MPPTTSERDWSATEVTWNQARQGEAWGTAGAKNTETDRADTYVPGFRLPLTAANVWRTLDMTDAVQRWLNDPASNEGVLLLASAPAAAQWVLASSDYGNVALRPRLTISYTLPSGTPTISPTPSRTATSTRTATPGARRPRPQPPARPPV